jgi:hypothetical protein
MNDTTLTFMYNYNVLHHSWGRSSVVEQRPFKPRVVGSIPTALTNLNQLLTSSKP